MPADSLPKAARAATPMAFVKAIVMGYERYGKDPAGALRSAQIAPRDVDDAQARVTAAQFEALNAHAMQELDDEALGWFSRRLPWGTYGMLCRASLTAPDLGVAIKRWCRHHRLVTEDVALGLRVAGGVATVTLEEHGAIGTSREFCLVSTLRFLHGYACWAVDSQIALREARFPFEAPPHRDAYSLMFAGTLHFGAPRASFSFDERYLALPIKRDERALRTMLRRALPLTVLQYRRDRLLGRRVRELLHGHAARAVTAEMLAAWLEISGRTLHRQLREEGLSLQALKDEVRQASAIDQLRRTSRSVGQIAQAVGFRNEKSFSRAFRAWTGTTPGEFRRAAIAPPVHISLKSSTKAPKDGSREPFPPPAVVPAPLAKAPAMIVTHRPTFDDAGLSGLLASMSDAELDELEFGVIGFDDATVVRRYNSYESKAAGLSPQRVLEHPLFTAVAPCMNNFLVAQRFEDAAEKGESLDDTIDYVLTLRMRPVKVRLRLLATPGAACRFVLVRRSA
jgi:photoactive yellow protein